jgi:sec-independent protein translocase protein TatA
VSTHVIAFLSLGPVEVVVILLVALLIFGRRLPEVARSLGQGLVEFRKGLRDEPADDDRPRPLPSDAGKTDEPAGESVEYAPDGSPEAAAQEEATEDETESEKRESPAG